MECGEETPVIGLVTGWLQIGSREITPSNANQLWFGHHEPRELQRLKGEEQKPAASSPPLLHGHASPGLRGFSVLLVNATAFVWPLDAPSSFLLGWHDSVTLSLPRLKRRPLTEAAC